jgi:glycosyltransferase involved in cell wall biosynthesis
LARRFDVVHVFRLGSLPLAEPWLSRSETEVWLDLDDLESRSARHLAGLLLAQGDVERAELEESRAVTLATAERSALTRCRRVFVASPHDIAALQGLGPAEVDVLPNVVGLPDALPPAAGPPWRILFVGTLGYEPNVEGLLWFATSVWPELRRAASDKTVIDIVGAGWLPGVQRLRRIDGIHVHGASPDVRPWYAGAHVAIVPIHAGGGTRIKALEAFAYGRPVVGTSFGLGGLDVEPDIHALIADEPGEFAAACHRLMSERSLGERITRNAHALVEARFTPETLAGIVARFR